MRAEEYQIELAEKFDKILENLYKKNPKIKVLKANNYWNVYVAFEDYDPGIYFSENVITKIHFNIVKQNGIMYIALNQHFGDFISDEELKRSVFVRKHFPDLLI